MAEQRVSACQSCGASIYPEHLDTGIAGYAGGRLLCPHCFAEHEKSHDSSADPLSVDENEEVSTIALLEEEKASGPGGTAMHGFSGDSFASGGAAIVDESKYSRRLDPKAPTATRCRTFHTKLNEGAVAFMNDQINLWADSNPGITIKFATSAIGIFEGKKADPNLIVTVFY